MVITQEEWESFYKLRERLFEIIRKVDDGYHKSYEGAIEVRIEFDNIFEAEDIRDVSFVEIELHCYLLVNGRHITWKGRTFSEALKKFKNWLKDTENNFID